MRLWCLLLLSVVGMNAGTASAGLLDQGQYPQGFAGVNWNSRPDTVKKKILARGGVTLVAQTPDQLRFSGGTFADESVLTWSFGFQRGIFRTGKVSFVPDDPENQYAAICRNIVNKYGKKGEAVRYTRDLPYGRTTWQFEGSLNGRWQVVCDFSAAGVSLIYEDRSGLDLKGSGLQSGDLSR